MIKKFVLFILCLILATSPTFPADRASGDNAAHTAQTTRTTSVKTKNQSRISTARVAQQQPRQTSGRTISGRENVTKPRNVTARAAADTSLVDGTKTGADYQNCKNYYFACMDQFCALKNENYKRCSCSDRVYELENIQSVVQDASVKLTEFNENLNVVGMTTQQATALRTSSEGEDALTSDTSASKALLDAIMNSIRGKSSSISGKYSGLNSINIAIDSSFGDSGQTIAAYNGKNLYSAIYTQCRQAVKSECTDASLQRSITAYLMSVEQDCNTVEKMITENQKKVAGAVRESSAMLNLARIENRQKHNSDDLTACLNNVESAILSEEVCGANYHKCLDNGKFIDIKTGKPIAGVVKFYELENMLNFSVGESIGNQKLAKNTANRGFVESFEDKTKKFAEPALDKCTEDADIVWADYLDKAMLEIYYQQKAKVLEIRQGCFDFVSTCYLNGDASITKAMSSVLTDSIALQPDLLNANDAICKEYVASCDNMFDGNIIEQYIAQRKDTDIDAACGAVVQQCFDEFGGDGYENFYNPQSGAFKIGYALDWFIIKSGDTQSIRQSPCFDTLNNIAACRNGQDEDANGIDDSVEKIFGGFDVICTDPADSTTCTYDYDNMRLTGIATQVFRKINDQLSTQCENLNGKFIQKRFIPSNTYEGDKEQNTGRLLSYCKFSDMIVGNKYMINAANDLSNAYFFQTHEYMCPKDYGTSIDTISWGACLCWENGGRRAWTKTDGFMAATVNCVIPTIRYGGVDHIFKTDVVTNKICNPSSYSNNICTGTYMNKVPESNK